MTAPDQTWVCRYGDVSHACSPGAPCRHGDCGYVLPTEPAPPPVPEEPDNDVLPAECSTPVRCSDAGLCVSFCRPASPAPTGERPDGMQP